MKKINNIKFNIKLTNSERKVLNAVYTYFKANAEWPLVRSIKNAVGIENVRKMLNKSVNKFGCFIPIGNLIEKDNNNINNLRLTLYGLLACSAADEDIKIILSYIDLLKSYRDSDKEKITSSEIEKSLNLSKEQSKRLCLIIQLGMGYFGDYIFRVEWYVVLPDEDHMDDIIEAGSSEKYLKNIISSIKNDQKNYEKSLNQKKNSNIPAGWISFSINIFFAGWILWLYHPNVLFKGEVGWSKILLSLIGTSMGFALLFSIVKIVETFLRRDIPFISGRKILEHWIWSIIIFIIASTAFLLYTI